MVFVKEYKNISHVDLYERMSKLFYRAEKSQLSRKIENRQVFGVFLQTR